MDVESEIKGLAVVVKLLIGHLHNQGALDLIEFHEFLSGTRDLLYKSPDLVKPSQCLDQTVEWLESAIADLGTPISPLAE